MRGKHLALAVVVLLCAAGAVGADVVVWPGDQAGWVIANQQGTAGSAPVANFVAGVGTPPAGSGSFHVQMPYSGTDPLAKVYVGTNAFSGTALTDITSLKYWTYVDSRAYDRTQPPMIELITDSGTTAQQRRFVFYPWGSSGTVNAVLDTWQEWDLMASGGRWELLNTSSGNYFGNWTWVVGRYPGAIIRTPAVGDYQDPLNAQLQLANQSGTSLSVKLGGGKAQDSRYGAWWQEGAETVSYFDKVVVGVNGVETIYDFEVVPEPASLAALGLGLAGFAGLRRKTR